MVISGLMVELGAVIVPSIVTVLEAVGVTNGVPGREIIALCA